jgi:hypothetical protein
MYKDTKDAHSQEENKKERNGKTKDPFTVMKHSQCNTLTTTEDNT